MNKKKVYGQFYTTNYEYILKNMNIYFFSVDIIEPFTGNGDLLKFTDNLYIKRNIICYDIDPKTIDTVKRDTLLNPPSYENKFILTNPPYLARNKSEDKRIFDKYKVNDLYKCFIKNLLYNQCEAGIIIIPVNFLCSIRKEDFKLRRDFCEVYHMSIINIFKNQVFDDTSTSVCCIQFYNRKNRFIMCECPEENLDNCNCLLSKETTFHIYPDNKIIKENLNEGNMYMVGGFIHNLPTTTRYKISRLTRLNLDQKNTNILLKCIDDSPSKWCNLKYIEDDDIFIDNSKNLSARSYATLVIIPIISEEKQRELVKSFNRFLSEKRCEYNSLFLSNYRENDRKRISFTFAFNLVNYLLTET